MAKENILYTRTVEGDGYLSLELTGVLDTVNAGEFTKAFTGFVEKHSEQIRGGTQVYVDLQRVPHLDCHGIGVLATGSKLLSNISEKQTLNVVALDHNAEVLTQFARNQELQVHSSYPSTS